MFSVPEYPEFSIICGYDNPEPGPWAIAKTDQSEMRFQYPGLDPYAYYNLVKDKFTGTTSMIPERNSVETIDAANVSVTYLTSGHYLEILPGRAIDFVTIYSRHQGRSKNDLLNRAPD